VEFRPASPPCHNRVSRISLAASAFTSFAAIVTLFQLGLVAGAPCSFLTQGGTHPGRLPVPARAGAAASAVLVTGFAISVLARAGTAFPGLRSVSHVAVWVVVGFSALSVVANAASRSRAVRAVWLPVGLALLGASLVVALCAAP